MRADLDTLRGRLFWTLHCSSDQGWVNLFGDPRANICCWGPADPPPIALSVTSKYQLIPVQPLYNNFIRIMHYVGIINMMKLLKLDFDTESLQQILNHSMHVGVGMVDLLRASN